MIQTTTHFSVHNYETVATDYAKMPVKPTLDGEVAYENSLSLRKDEPQDRRIAPADVRRAAYWAVFAGAHGHTYGTHPIWQMYDEGRKPLWEVVTPWHRALDLPGATQLIYLKRLMLSRPYVTRIPDQSAILSEPPQGVERVQVTRDGRPGQDDATYLLAYFPCHHRLTFNTGRIAGTTLHGWWYNPRTGTATSLGEMNNAKRMEFAPPTNVPGEDWVLVLDAAAKNMLRPGCEKWTSATWTLGLLWEESIS